MVAEYRTPYFVMNSNTFRLIVGSLVSVVCVLLELMYLKFNFLENFISIGW